MNSAEFKNFKIHADSTLKGMTKDELISYIHMLHHNWEVCDDMIVSFRTANLEKYEYINTLERENNVLKSALDKACERLETYDMLVTDDDDRYYWKAEKWKEELMKDETD